MPRQQEKLLRASQNRMNIRGRHGARIAMRAVKSFVVGGSDKRRAHGVPQLLNSPKTDEVLVQAWRGPRIGI